MNNGGVLFGVSVGPGDPRLLTLRAAEVLRESPVIAAPRTKGGRMVALDIARKAVDLDGKTIVPLDFVMSRDRSVSAASHRIAADSLRPHLDRGIPVAMPNLGDVSVYSSFRYVADILKADGYATEMIPGVPSFCAAAAALNAGLADIGTPIHIIPDGTVPAALRDRDATTVWMKSGSGLPDLLRSLEAEGLLDRTMLVQNCGMENQRVIVRPDAAAVVPDYFSIVILKADRDGGGKKS